MAAVHHLGLVGRTFGPPTMTTEWSLSLCEIWLELINSFDNMKLSTFCPFGAKTPIHPPKIVFGGSPPK